MGIFIDLYVSGNVTEEEWLSVYEESFRLVKAFHLMDSEVLEVYGHRLICGVPTEEAAGENGWCAVGDSVTMGRGEAQYLPGKLVEEKKKRAVPAGKDGGRKSLSGFPDPLLAAAPGRTLLDWRDARCGGCIHLWGNKTQGEAYHIYLLAIGCMLETRLGGKACVDGDITLGQCRKAVQLANQYLNDTEKPPVRLPVRCEAERLYERIRALPLKKEEVLNVFHNLYLGALDAEYGSFLRGHFTGEEQALFWKREFADLRIGGPGFASALRDFLNLGNSLEELCRCVSFTDRDGAEYYREFVEEIMRSRLFLKEKDLRNPLEIDRESETPYSIYTLLAQYTLSDAKNYSVNRYIPPEKIRETLERFIGGYCDVGGIMEDYLKREGQRKEEPVSVLNDLMEKKMAEIKEKEKKYDICGYRELLHYRRGDRIAPEIEESCRKLLKLYGSLCEEERFAELMEGEPEERNAFLVYQNRDIFLMEEKWRAIFKEVEEKPESFRRYYPMVRVQADETGKQIIYAYVINEAFYQYMEGN